MGVDAKAFSEIREPPFINDERFLHHINAKNLMQVLNFLPGGGGYASPASLDLEFLAEIGADPNRIHTARMQKQFYTLSEQQLLRGLDHFVAIGQSPRMEILITASRFRNGLKVGQANLRSIDPIQMDDGWFELGMDMVWSDEIDDKEQKVLDLSEVEIAFELARREYAPDAPSRITCLYMVEDTFEGRMTVYDMYKKNKQGPNYKPVLLKLGVVHQVKYTKVDSAWYLKYFQDRKKSYLEQYWLGGSTNKPCYEILFEGMVGLSDRIDKDKLASSYRSMTRT